MKTSQKALCYFLGLILLMVITIIGSLWIWYMEIVVITLIVLVGISFLSALILYVKNSTSFAFGLSMSLLASCMLGSFLMVVMLAPDVGLDEIQYGDDTYVGVTLEANTYYFASEEKVLWIWRDYNCLCQMSPGPYDEIQWGKYGDNGLAIYINSNGYLWDINKNLGRACLPCDSIPSFNYETQS